MLKMQYQKKVEGNIIFLVNTVLKKLKQLNRIDISSCMFQKGEVSKTYWDLTIFLYMKIAAGGTKHILIIHIHQIFSILDPYQKKFRVMNTMKM